MNRNGVVCSDAGEVFGVLIIENLLAGRIQTEELGNSTAGDGPKRSAGSVIDKVIERSVFVATAADRTIDALVHWKFPYFSRDLSYQIQAILSRTAKGASLSWGLIEREKAIQSVVVQ